MGNAFDSYKMIWKSVNENLVISTIIVIDDELKLIEAGKHQK